MTIKLGLIGGNIAQSKAPLLHRLAGRRIGLDVIYELMMPYELGLDFRTTFERAQALGFRGINVTYPFKEEVSRSVRIDDPSVRLVGAVNTVLFEQDGPEGHNTDYSGFIRAYRNSFGNRPPGMVCMVGAGGVGKAVAFGLVEMGAVEIRIVDHDAAKAEGLAHLLRNAARAITVSVCSDVETAADAADGFVNCTPLGMHGHAGSAIDVTCLKGGSWAFDAVYTPIETEFLLAARRQGLSILSGFELFLFQGADAFRLFTEQDIDPETLRADLS